MITFCCCYSFFVQIFKSLTFFHSPGLKMTDDFRSIHFLVDSCYVFSSSPFFIILFFVVAGLVNDLCNLMAGQARPPMPCLMLCSWCSTKTWLTINSRMDGMVAGKIFIGFFLTFFFSSLFLRFPKGIIKPVIHLYIHQCIAHTHTHTLIREICTATKITNLK